MAEYFRRVFGGAKFLIFSYMSKKSMIQNFPRF